MSGKRFSGADVERVKREMLKRFGGSIVDVQTFIRAYDYYAEDSYLKCSNGYTPNFEDGQSLDGSDVDNFMSCVWVALATNRNLEDAYINQKEREKKGFLEIAQKKKVIEAGIIPEYAPKEAVIAAKKKFAANVFKFAGRQKNAIVTARKIEINTRYGKQKRYIDRKGRYVGMKKK